LKPIEVKGTDEMFPWVKFFSQDPEWLLSLFSSLSCFIWLTYGIRNETDLWISTEVSKLKNRFRKR